MMRWGLVLPVMLAAASGFAQPVSASVARLVRDEPCRYMLCNGAEPQFRAADGEANDVLVDVRAGPFNNEVLFTDNGAVLTAGSNCTSLDAHTVKCSMRSDVGLHAPSIRLGDGEDRFQGSDDGVSVTGGLGNDTIVGSSESDAIVGGPGTDFLDGAGGVDGLVFRDAAPGLRVDMESVEPQGYPSDPDRFQNFEDVTAMKAPGAELLGDDGKNRLYAGPGGRVHGRGGDDAIYAGPAGHAFGGPGDDVLEVEIGKRRRGDGQVVDCGAGNDLVETTAVFDVARESCEFVSPDGTDGFVGLHQQPGDGPFATLRYYCLNDDGTCPIEIWGRVGSTRGTVVFKRRVAVPPYPPESDYPVRLNRRGRALLNERGRLKVTVFYVESPEDPEFRFSQGFSIVLRP